MIFICSPEAHIQREKGLKPSDYGLQSIADNPQWLRIYNDTLRSVASGKNKYTHYLQLLEKGITPTWRHMDDAWSAVSTKFLSNVRKAGFEIKETHHWNWSKTKYPQYLFDSRNLFPILKSQGNLHWTIHENLTTHPDPKGHFWNRFKGSVRPEAELGLGNARSTLDDSYSRNQKE